MADRKARRQQRAKDDSTEDRLTKSRLEAEKDVGALDNPDVPEEPSELRHIAYFVGVIALAVGLNFIAMLIVSGGR